MMIIKSMKIKKLIEKLEDLDGELEVKVIDDNENEMVIWDVLDGEIWVGEK